MEYLTDDLVMQIALEQEEREKNVRPFTYEKEEVTHIVLNSDIPSLCKKYEALFMQHDETLHCLESKREEHRAIVLKDTFDQVPLTEDERGIINEINGLSKSISDMYIKLQEIESLILSFYDYHHDSEDYELRGICTFLKENFICHVRKH